MRTSNERGNALVLSLLLTMVVSVLASSFMFLAQTETYASTNYRLMSQTRYGAESGVHKAVHYLLNNYPAPGGAGDPLANYNMNVSPVTFNNQPVVLSASAAVPGNYPVLDTQAAFNAEAQGALAVGTGTVQYSVYATLMSMKTFTVYGQDVTAVVQTWKITADGQLTAGHTADVQVTAVLEQQTVPAATYAAFATNNLCGALTLSGNVVTDSYDSSNITYDDGKVVTTQSNGNVGTNGNLTEGGSTTVINGQLFTPRTGVGNCKNGAVDALTANGGATVTGGLVQLPQPVTYPSPAEPSPEPPTSNVGLKNNDCGGLANPAACTIDSVTKEVRLVPGTQAAPVALGNISVTAGGTIHLGAAAGCPCYYNVNSIKLVGNSTVKIDGGPVVFNVQGEDEATPIDLTGGSLVNLSINPANFQIVYAGTGNVKLAGGNRTAAMVYAPNASVTLAGGSNFFGSLLAATVSDTGGTAIHYDRHLQASFEIPGNYVMSSFSWKTY